MGAALRSSRWSLLTPGMVHRAQHSRSTGRLAGGAIGLYKWSRRVVLADSPVWANPARAAKCDCPAEKVVPMPSPCEVRLRKPPDPTGLSQTVAHVLVEPLNRACPCLLGRGLVVAFRRRVIEEAMNRIRIDMAFVPDVVFLQLGFLRRIGPR